MDYSEKAVAHPGQKAVILGAIEAIVFSALRAGLSLVVLLKFETPLFTDSGDCFWPERPSHDSPGF
jgi:hypothetical protein